MSQCSFCKLKNNAKNTILYVDDLSVVLMANPRKIAGHLLVIPKRHVERLDELRKPELDTITTMLSILSQKIAHEFSEGYDIAQHYRPFTREDGIKVSHLHFHLLPRYKDDPLHIHLKDYERGVLADVTEKERNAMKGFFETNIIGSFTRKDNKL